MEPYIFNIQRYSIHDGDGIRATVFFKGCPLKCAWCHNPESQRFAPEMLFNSEKCSACAACASVCPVKAIATTSEGMQTDKEKCTLCGTCLDFCTLECREIAGRTYTTDELVFEIKKDLPFYEQSGGGVTLSGGEVMAQSVDYLEALMERLHSEGISVNIDTCGFAPYSSFERILPYTDTFLYDLKEMDSKRHFEYTGVGNELILENLKKLSNADARISLRLPLIEDFNANEQHISKIIDFLKSGVNVQRIHLLPYHDIGKSKYSKLGREYQEQTLFSAPSDEKLKSFVGIFNKNGFSDVLIGG